MNILFLGDVYGSAGRKAIKEILPQIKKEKTIDFCIANGENAAGGSGLTHVVAQELYKLGIDAITMGNHTWSKREITNFIDSDKKIIRPANYPPDLPGKGSQIVSSQKGSIGIVNVLGRVYMDPVDSPFLAVEREITELKKSVKIVIVDIHAEASSEKAAIAWQFDGRVSAVLGTHTHVQTADERILPCGTAFMTDVGMTGPRDGIIGVDREIILKKFLTNMPVKFEVAKGDLQFNAIYMEIDEKTGRTQKVERILRNIYE